MGCGGQSECVGVRMDLGGSEWAYGGQNECVGVRMGVWGS